MQKRMDLLHKQVEKWLCAMKNFRNFHHPNLRSPPLTIFMNSTADKTPSCGTQPGLFLCFVLVFLFLCSGETRDILGSLFFLDCGREMQLDKRLVLGFFCPAQAWLDWLQPIGFLQRAQKFNNGGWRFKRTLVFWFTTIKKTTVTWKEKSWKKVCEMSQYLTLIPLLREMCFPAIIPGWWRKNYRKLKFLWLSFWANEQMWYGFETIFFFNYSISPTLLPAFILDPWRKTFLYILSIIGFISVFMAGDKMAGYVNWPLPTSPAPTSLSSFSLFPISDTLLPVSSCSF